MREAGSTGEVGGGEASTSDIVCEFLEAAVHTALRVKGVRESLRGKNIYEHKIDRAASAGHCLARLCSFVDSELTD